MAHNGLSYQLTFKKEINDDLKTHLRDLFVYDDSGIWYSEDGKTATAALYTAEDEFDPEYLAELQDDVRDEDNDNEIVAGTFNYLNLTNLFGSYVFHNGKWEADGDDYDIPDLDDDILIRVLENRGYSVKKL